MKSSLPKLIGKKENFGAIDVNEKSINSAEDIVGSRSNGKEKILNKGRKAKLNTSENHIFKGDEMHMETNESSLSHTQSPSEKIYHNQDFQEVIELNSSEPDQNSVPNQLSVTVSYSLHSQLRQMARMEGVNIEDIVIELIAEGVTKRAFEELGRPAPSHLMTRTGYMPPDANSHVQPTLSHHINSGHLGNSRPSPVRRFNQTPNGHSVSNYNNNGHKPFNNRFSNKNRHPASQNINPPHNRTDQEKERHVIHSKRHKDSSRS